MYCPGKYCFTRGKYESLDGYVTTPRYIYGCGKCGALFLQISSFVTRARKDDNNRQKTLFFAKKSTLVPNKQLLPNFPFQLTKYGKKELCVESKVQETVGDVYCPTCRNEKFVYISTNKTASLYDCKKCKAC